MEGYLYKVDNMVGKGHDYVLSTGTRYFKSQHVLLQQGSYENCAYAMDAILRATASGKSPSGYDPKIATLAQDEINRIAPPPKPTLAEKELADVLLQDDWLRHHALSCGFRSPQNAVECDIVTTKQMSVSALKALGAVAAERGL